MEYKLRFRSVVVMYIFLGERLCMAIQYSSYPTKEIEYREFALLR